MNFRYPEVFRFILRSFDILHLEMTPELLMTTYSCSQKLAQIGEQTLASSRSVSSPPVKNAWRDSILYGNRNRQSSKCDLSLWEEDLLCIHYLTAESPFQNFYPQIWIFRDLFYVCICTRIRKVFSAQKGFPLSTHIQTVWKKIP